jgi:hypothetical protein
MNEANPYQPPDAAGIGEQAAQPSRTIVTLAAVGAWIASAYWALLTLLIAFAAASGATSFGQVIIPIILIGLYAVRGFQLFKGDPTAARNLLWLHGVGGVMAAIQIAGGGGIVMVLQGIKLVIHVFGGFTALRAQRALMQSY